jgi:glutathione reductase (NADPH)
MSSAASLEGHNDAGSRPALPHGFDYDLVVLGGGSAGMGCARRAALHGARAAIVEAGAIGGTCVNVGCVPKKVGFAAATLSDTMGHLESYGFTGATPDKVAELRRSFSLKKHVEGRTAYVKRLNGIYEANLKRSGIDLLENWGEIAGPNTIRLHKPNSNWKLKAPPSDEKEGESSTVTAKHIVIATGGRPSVPKFAGGEHTINSDDFFDLEEVPERVVVIGAGYVAVELAGILHHFGADVTLCTRYEYFLRGMDEIIHTNLKVEMKACGVNFCSGKTVQSISLDAMGKKVLHFTDGHSHGPFDSVVYAVGRDAVLEGLGLETLGCDTCHGFVEVDEYQRTNVDCVYALGDVCHVKSRHSTAPLTPVAIEAGRKLSDRLFGGIEDAKCDYDDIPTVVFSHPTAGTVGMTEAEAGKAFGEDNVITHVSVFRNMYFAMLPEDHKQKTYMKIVCRPADGVDEDIARKDTKLQKVVGIHILGLAADEVIQGFAVALKMGATKHDLDRTMAIHPTAAEELVTM